ncbi:MAG: elongation factor G [Elusimicrobia bacterium]|nr:elongation factor G [Elusimicrobiota bacterium]
MEVAISNLRNIGIVAHIDAGKTTTTERILYYTGRIFRMGEVHEGTTTMDWLEDERKRGITIQSAVTSCFWQLQKRKFQINIIDTPGHVDFTAEVERSLRVLDGCVVVFCGVGGVEPQSETVWRQATKYKVPIIAFVNKLDRVGSDFEKVVKEMKENFPQKIVPIALPVGREKDFRGIVDVVEGSARIYADSVDGSKWTETEIPPEMTSAYYASRSELIEVLSETDDEILEKYVENKEVPSELIKKALREATIKKGVVPVICGSAFKNKGIQFLLDGICEYLPSPADIPTTTIFDVETLEPREVENSENGDFWALVFKIVTDQFLGKLSYIRVYSGRFFSGRRLYNTNRGKTEKIDRIFSVHADKKEAVKQMAAGDIVAVGGLKQTKTGDTLCSQKQTSVFEPPTFPEPVICQAIEPESPSQIDVLATALSKISDEDPTFIVKNDPVTGESVIYGMGELHLEVNVARLQRDFKVPVKVSKPKVRYKEGITKEVELEGKYVKQTGGHGQYAHIVVKIVRNENANFEFENRIKGGAIPSQFIPAVEEGARIALDTGPLAGFPVSNVKVVLLDGSFHEVDSSDLAFRLCAIETVGKALKKAAPILLEPIMFVEIHTPTQFLGDVLGDINSRRGTCGGLTTENNLTTIKAFAPLAEMFGYATTLRSLTQGRGSYVMEPHSYEAVPTNIADKVIGKI